MSHWGCALNPERSNLIIGERRCTGEVRAYVNPMFERPTVLWLCDGHWVDNQPWKG